jgi:glycosyltransferase involved in cell wall biosynthesis
MNEDLKLDGLKVAIVCDWLTDYAGAERVIYEMHQLFPNAPIFTTLYDRRKCKVFKDADVCESALRFIPFARKVHRLIFPLMPGVFERMDLSEYDVVLSSAHSAAKGVITKPETLHVSYCHSPMRYVWDRSHSYQKGFRLFALLSVLTRPILHKVRMWDRLAAERVDRFVVNSAYIGRRVRKYYGRESEVIHPPVDLSFFRPGDGERDYYLAVGRLIPYKRFDLVVEAFNKMGKPLKIVGVGPDAAKLKLKGGKNVEFVGKVTDDELHELYQGAKALIFPQLEDFGIVPLEAMASGAPVIAYGAGGALETVKDGVSGLFFKEQTVDALVDAVERFEAMAKKDEAWDSKNVADSVSDFASARFKSELRHFIEAAWREHANMA